MRVSRLSIGMHAALSKHLSSEFCSATLTFKDGSTMKVVRLDAWRRDRVTAYAHGADEGCEFDPSKVVGIKVEAFDLDLMALSEAEDLRLVLDADAVRRLTPNGSVLGAQAAE